MKPGDTFLVDVGHGTHLHIVLSNPYGTDKDQLIIVTMVSTYDEHYKNATCILRPTDGHPFIKHLSYVAYNLTREIRISDIEKAIVSKMPPLSEEVLHRILKGANDNNSDMPNKYWIILDNQGLIP